MEAIASQITSLTIVYSIVNSEADQRKHQSSASLAFVRGIHRGPVNSLHKSFHLMTSSWGTSKTASTIMPTLYTYSSPRACFVAILHLLALNKKNRMLIIYATTGEWFRMSIVSIYLLWMADVCVSVCVCICVCVGWCLCWRWRWWRWWWLGVLQRWDKPALRLGH